MRIFLSLFAVLSVVIAEEPVAENVEVDAPENEKDEVEAIIESNQVTEEVQYNQITSFSSFHL
jgi:hypothetical protein